MRNCVDIVRPFVYRLHDEGLAEDRVQLIGGVGSAALQEVTTQLSPESRTIIAPSGLYLSERRSHRLFSLGKWNVQIETTRDLDGLVKTTDEVLVDKVEAAAKETVGEVLKLSFFGLHYSSELTRQAKHPGISSLAVWVSDRYVDSPPAIEGRLYRSLFPFRTEVDPAVMETWHLLIGDDLPIPVPHPGAAITNYLVRSISGVRAKDIKDDKLAAIADKVLSSPDLRTWVMDGPGQALLDFARVLHTLRTPRHDPHSLEIGQYLRIEAITNDELLDYTDRQIVNGKILTLQALIKLARLKSQLLHAAESQDTVVAVWQKFIESTGVIDRILKNK